MRRKAWSLVPLFVFLAAWEMSPGRNPRSGPAASLTSFDRVLVAETFPNRAEVQTAKALATYQQLPLSFEPNQGQASADVKFVARGNGSTLWLTETGAVLSLHGGAASTPALRELLSVDEG